MPLLAPVPQLLWGTNFETVLPMGYRLDNLVAYPNPRAGSEFVQYPSGTEDSWVTGTDFLLEADLRWLPWGPTTNPTAEGWSSPLGVGALLTWARQKNKLRFCPDQNFPGFSVDAYLVEPLQDTPPTSESDATLRTRIKLRQAVTPFDRVMRGLLFDYAPGADLTGLLQGSSMAATVARSTTGMRYAIDGSLAFDAINVLRDRHYAQGLGGLRTTLVEPSRTNSCLQSETLATAPWSPTNLTVTNASLVEADGRPLCLLVPNVTSAQHWTQQGITITANEFVAASCVVRAKEYSGVILRVSDSGSTNGIDVSVDLTTGAITGAGGVGRAFGTGTLTNAKVVPLQDNRYRILLWGAIGNAITALTAFVIAFDTGAHAGSRANYAGDGTSGMYASEVQVERMGTTEALPPTSYIVTTTTTQTRGGDTFAYGLPVANVLPTWLYAKFYERGEVTRSGGVRRIIAISTFGSNPRLILYATGGSYTCSFVSAGGVQTGSSAAAAPNYGDLVELLGWYDAAGNVNLVQAINGVSAGVVTAAGAPVPSGSWGTAAIGIGQEGDLAHSVVSHTELLRAKAGVQGFAGRTVQTIADALAA